MIMPAYSANAMLGYLIISAILPDGDYAGVPINKPFFLLKLYWGNSFRQLFFTAYSYSGVPPK
jgi:hypothetical protein